jgi:hypothetical protein
MNKKFSGGSIGQHNTVKLAAIKLKNLPSIVLATSNVVFDLIV